MPNSIRFRLARSLMTAAAIAVALFVFVGCASGPSVETETVETPDGVTVVQTSKQVATVLAVDAAARTVTLQAKHGEPQTLKVHDIAGNFDQVQVGDEVHAEVVEELAITLIRGGSAESTSEAEAVAVSPLGAKPAIVMVDSIQSTAKIIAIDGHHHSVTLEFLDGTTRVLKVSKKRDLSDVMLGDAVQVRITEGIAIAVTKPAKD